ncbi:HSP20-like chaperone [Plenodomus tracheiphilus IPT5]|uniref:HSP20-like chaperone n=1 Tax=Plenodomus tracheiphilus IPT5 TaxID=1408161 RepID=A0A6A7B2V3_9PLEO|nr:HSP20-like chaperone [Plenodomus tracheiphilus IPT5]
MFVLTPRFAPAYQAPQCSPFGFCAPASQPVYNYRVSRPRPQPRRPQYSSFNNFFSQVDELLGEIDREAQRQAQLEAHLEAHRQQQERRNQALRARFTVNQTEQGWQVDGDIQGFNQDNINIELTDEHTLKITGNTEWQSEKAQSEEQQPEPAAIAAPEESQQQIEHEEATNTETVSIQAAAPDSDTESHKSYQPTVEDDYEDLGAETSSLISTPSRSSTPAMPAEPKGKERAVEQPTPTETAVVQQPQAEVPAPQQQPQKEERVHGTFQRTFRFPERIDASNVSASFKEGVLSITVPRAQIPQTRRIAIL